MKLKSEKRKIREVKNWSFGKINEIDKSCCFSYFSHWVPHKFPIRDQQLILLSWCYVRASPPESPQERHPEGHGVGTVHKAQTGGREKDLVGLERTRKGEAGKDQPPGALPGVQDTGEVPGEFLPRPRAYKGSRKSYLFAEDRSQPPWAMKQMSRGPWGLRKYFSLWN